MNSVNNKNYKFIVFEGPDGSGKSSIIDQLNQNWTENFKKEVLFTREPGGKGSELCEDIRRLIFESKYVFPITEAYLYAASRIQHLEEVIIPAIKHFDKVVISDRFIDSSLAYQGAGRNFPVQFVKDINKFAFIRSPRRFTFFFKIDPEVALERQNKNKQEKNRFDKESLDFHKKVYGEYLSIIEANKEDYYVIDASRDKDVVYKEVLTKLKELIS